MISFGATGTATVVDSVWVEYLTQGTRLMVGSGNQLQLLGTVSVADPGSVNSLNALMVYPNPSDGEILVTFKSTTDAWATIDLSDLMGRQVATAKMLFSVGVQSLYISGLKIGTYLVRVGTEHNNYSGKIICRSSSKSSSQIRLQKQSTVHPVPGNLKKVTAVVVMQYNMGDLLNLLDGQAFMSGQLACSIRR